MKSASVDGRGGRVWRCVERSGGDRHRGDEIQITSAANDYLQVAEVVAMDFGGVDVAFAGNGGTVFAPDQYSSTSRPATPSTV